MPWRWRDCDYPKRWHLLRVYTTWKLWTAASSTSSSNLICSYISIANYYYFRLWKAQIFSCSCWELAGHVSLIDLAKRKINADQKRKCFERDIPFVGQRGNLSYTNFRHVSCSRILVFVCFGVCQLNSLEHLARRPWYIQTSCSPISLYTQLTYCCWLG